MESGQVTSVSRPVPLHFCTDCGTAIQARGKNGAGWALVRALKNSQLTSGKIYVISGTGR